MRWRARRATFRRFLVRRDVILELDDPDDLSVGMTAVSAGKYEVGFQVYDYSENYSEQFVEIEVTK